MEAGDRLPSLDAMASWTNWLVIKENCNCSTGCKETWAVMSVSKVVWDPGVDVAGRVEAPGTDVLGGMDDSVVMDGDVVVDKEGSVKMIGNALFMLCIAW